jgi:predicted nucleotidyltransferase
MPAPRTFASLPIFRSELQARLLGLLLLHPERSWPAPELQRRLGAIQQTTYNELRRLVDAGLLTAESVGRTKLYRAATESPLYEPLRDLVARTVGPEVMLRERLADVAGVEVAALFGSWADERLRPTSDIDVLVVGELDFDELASAVRDVEDLSGREIHLVVFTPAELEQKLREGSGFVRNVLSGNMKMLVGQRERLPQPQ